MGASKTRDSGSNGILADFPADLREQAEAALEAERQSIDKGIDAWKKVVAGAPEGTYLLFGPMASLKELDEAPVREKAIMEAMGADNQHQRGQADTRQSVSTTRQQTGGPRSANRHV